MRTSKEGTRFSPEFTQDIIEKQLASLPFHLHYCDDDEAYIKIVPGHTESITLLPTNTYLVEATPFTDFAEVFKKLCNGQIPGT